MSINIQPLEKIQLVAGAMAIAMHGYDAGQQELLDQTAQQFARHIHEANMQAYNARYSEDNKPKDITLFAVEPDYDTNEVRWAVDGIHVNTYLTDDNPDLAKDLARLEAWLMAPVEWAQVVEPDIYSEEDPPPLPDNPVGYPVLDSYGKKGWVLRRLKDDAHDVFNANFDRGRLEKISPVKYSVVYVNTSGDDFVSSVYRDDLNPMLVEATKYQLRGRLSEAQILLAEQRIAQQAEKREREVQAAQNKAKAERTLFLARAKECMPANAKAVIVAKEHVNESDSQTDYYGHSTVRVLILAWSTHTRDLFPEMRKAAANAEETQHLSDAPSEYENREKWTGGGGYYLAKHRHSGWSVAKVPLGYGKDFVPNIDAIPTGEWRIPDSVSAARSTKTSGVSAEPAMNVLGGVSIEKHTHTKKQTDMWICVLNENLAKDEFYALRTQAKSMGGWYSRKWRDTPGGFAFPSEVEARSFVEAIAPEAIADAEPESVQDQETENTENTAAEKGEDISDINTARQDFMDQLGPLAEDERFLRFLTLYTRYHRNVNSDLLQACVPTDCSKQELQVVAFEQVDAVTDDPAAVVAETAGRYVDLQKARLGRLFARAHTNFAETHWDKALPSRIPPREKLIWIYDKMVDGELGECEYIDEQLCQIVIPASEAVAGSDYHFKYTPVIDLGDVPAVHEKASVSMAVGC